MSITTVCPLCQASWHVQDSLLGKPLRCPSPACRHVFIVTAQPSTPSTAPSPSRQPSEPERSTSLHVSDLIELVPVEPEHPAPQAPTVKNWWEQAPPPPASPARSGSNGNDSPKSEPAPEPKPHWDAPPVRRSTPTPVSEADSHEPASVPESNAHEEPVAEPAEEPIHAPHGWLARWIILPFVAFTLVALGVGGIFLMLALRENEAQLTRKADQTYDDGQFRTAGDLYEQLLSRYPDSENRTRFAFRRQLCVLRDSLVDPPDDITELLASFGQFLDDWQKDELFLTHLDDYSKTLTRLLVEYAKRAAAAPKDEQPLATIRLAESLLSRVRAVKRPRGVAAPDFAPVESAFGELRQAVARMNQRRKLLDTLTALANQPSYANLVQFERVIKQAESQFPGLRGAADVQKLQQQLLDGHRKVARFVEQTGSKSVQRSITPLSEPALIVDPLIQGTSVPSSREEGVVLALDRGMLYALEPSNGQVRWPLRVGIDTTTLPVRVPRRLGIPERILVLSSDSGNLTALEDSGRQVWSYPLREPVLGRPVVVDQRAYLATYNGEIHEIELNEGHCLGRYVLQHRLTQGGTADPESKRVYFPADDGCVYVLNVADRRCEAILYSRHPAGSLRGELMILPSPGEGMPSLLVLTQASRLDQIRLRVFELPIVDGQSRERELKPPAELQGWTWFAPYHDPEKIVLLSDEATLGVFGIRQPGTRDQDLFSLVPGGGLKLTEQLGIPSGQRVARQRAEVVQLQGNDLWVLAAGRLQRLSLMWNPTQGPQLVPQWPDEPLNLHLHCGAPIHASQHLDSPLGTQHLITVTRAPDRSCCWVSRIDEETGKLLWRRQLGLVAHRVPVPLQMPQGEPVWLVSDASGTLLAIDPLQVQLQDDELWLSLPRKSYLADGLTENPEQPPLILPSADGKSAYGLVFPKPRELMLRTIRPTGQGRQVEAKTLLPAIALPEPLAGEPILLGDEVILPLADGALARVTLAPTPSLEIGPNWRLGRAAADARCVLLALSATRFLSSDGGHGLHCWEWKPGSNSPDPLPEGRDEVPVALMPGRIVGLARLGEQVAVADSLGNLRLFTLQPTGSLEAGRSWKFTDTISDGPFLCGKRLACLLAGNRLAWIDPNQDGAQWIYESPGLDPLVGRPLLLDDKVIVVDQSGLYLALSEKTGQPLNRGDPLERGYQLIGSIAPATSPILLHPNRLLAPLSDGTLMLLGLDRLMPPVKK